MRKLLASVLENSSFKFGPAQAEHLLRRTGFGATPAKIEQAVNAGAEETVESLFQEHPDQEQRLSELMTSIGGSLLNLGDPGSARAWWIYRIQNSLSPLREKLTLFWHGHFATSVEKVEDMRLMLQQQDLLRQHAWGNFAELVLGIAKDPAMLVYLDGQSSTKEHPNENFARELMELFTCGIGGYTEKDVLESARAFTGWHRDGAKFVFQADEHDAGIKTILGRRGNFDGKDVIELLMAHPQTPQFLARKLLRFFATPSPEADIVQEAAVLLDRSQLSIKWFLRDLFLSEYFYSPACYRQRISSPVEFVLGTVHSLGIRKPAAELAEQISQMGQTLFAPPNVKGWDGEQTWINSNRLAARVQFGRSIAELPDDSDSLGGHLPISVLVPEEVIQPAEIVSRLLAVLLPDGLSADVQAELAQFLLSNEEGEQPEQFRDDYGFRQQQTKALLGLIISLPEFQTV